MRQADSILSKGFDEAAALGIDAALRPQRVGGVRQPRNEALAHNGKPDFRICQIGSRHAPIVT
jgi:hypothetical protein